MDAVVFQVLIPSLIVCGLIVQLLYNPNKLTLQYRLKRELIFFAIGSCMSCALTLYYIFYDMNTEQVWARMELDKTQFGYLLSAGLAGLIVGNIFGPVINSFVRSSRRLLFAGISLIVCVNGFCGLSFFLSPPSSLYILTPLFFLHNIGWTWAYISVTKIMGTWFEQNEKGLLGGIFMGFTMLSFLLSSALTQFVPEHIHFAFWIPSAALVLIFVLSFPFVVENANSFTDHIEPPALIYRRSNRSGSNKIEESFRAGHVDSSTNSRLNWSAVWPLFNEIRFYLTMLGAFCIGFARDSFLQWYPSFLEKERDIKTGTSEFSMIGGILTLSAICGPFIGGLVSDSFLRCNRKPVILLYSIVTSVAFVQFFYLTDSLAQLLCLLGALQWCLVGNVSLYIIALPFDYGPLQPFVLCLTCVVIYGAGMISGFVMGRILDLYGYEMWKLLNAVTSAVAVVSTASLMIVDAVRLRRRQSMKEYKEPLLVQTTLNGQCQNRS
eukprot:GILK01008181.1.p1 GENE.GILK01008181.1~~GILK01008181.1.p1  ORF type:complete len:521 (+),score=59.72 GILK01008181.1:82-1563(+)